MSLNRFALLVCDLQKKTIKNLYYKNNVINNVNLLLNLKPQIPDIKVSIKSEFLPKKLGNTSEYVNTKNIDYVYEKTTYTMVNEDLIKYLENYNIDSIILTGMEIQWCISKTVKDLSKYYEVYIPTDAVGNSKNNEENIYNFQHLKNNSGILTTTDSLICNFTNDSDDELSKKYLDILKQNKNF